MSTAVARMLANVVVLLIAVGLLLVGVAIVTEWRPPGWQLATPIGAAIDLAESNERETEVIVQPVELRVEPIHLDCRARVTAEFPVEVDRQHQVAGVTYRTDTLRMTAVGDVDTCVDGGTHRVTTTQSGVVLVEIPAESIRLVRPRVDAVATADSVTTSKGWIGDQTDRFPGVSDDIGLTPDAYALAQQIIGSSECIGVAMAETERLIVAGYRQAAIDAGADPEQLTVRIDGDVELPAFDPATFNGLDWQIGAIDCTVVDADPAGGGDAR